MEHDYDVLLHQTGNAPPQPSHAMTVAHPHPTHIVHPTHVAPPMAHAPPAPVIHDARAIAHEVMSHLQQHLPQQQHPSHYPPPPPPGYYPPHEHERHPPRHVRHEHRYEELVPALEYSRRGAPKHVTNPQDVRMFPIGFVQAAVPPGTTAEIEVKPQVRFQGKRLAVAPSIARFFNIVDIKVGKDSQLAATGELTAEALSALAVDVRVELDPAPPGIVITLFARNKDTGPQDFEAVLYGLVEEDES